MHDTALLSGRTFFRHYAPLSHFTVLDVGALDINGTLRPCVPKRATYIGIDVTVGRNVDIVLEDPYSFPFSAADFDLVISTSCLEHDEMFWLTFAEMVRVVKPSGYIYISAPVNGPVHRHPVDCWRFYPDAAEALCRWANRCGHDIEVLESFNVPPKADVWIDFVAIFVRLPRSNFLPEPIKRVVLA